MTSATTASRRSVRAVMASRRGMSSWNVRPKSSPFLRCRPRSTETIAMAWSSE